MVSGHPNLKQFTSCVLPEFCDFQEPEPEPQSLLLALSHSKVNKGCQIGPCFLLQAHYCREQEVNNFQMLEQMLGPEEEDEHVGQSFGCGGEEEDSEWSYLDEHVGVEHVGVECDSACANDGRGTVL